MTEKEITPHKFARTASRQAGLLAVEARFRTDERKIVTILKRGGLKDVFRGTPSVIFNVKDIEFTGSKPWRSYQEIQVVSKDPENAMLRTGIEIYDFKTYAQNDLAVLLRKKPEQTRIATGADLAKMYRIASDLRRAKKLDELGRWAYQRKETTLFARQFEGEVSRLLTVSNTNSPAHFATKDYLYKVSLVKEGDSRSFCLSELNFSTQIDQGWATVFPQVEYKLEAGKKQVQKGTSEGYGTVTQEGDVLWTPQVEFKSEAAGIVRSRGALISSHDQKAGLISRLHDLGEEQFVPNEAINTVLLSKKRKP